MGKRGPHTAHPGCRAGLHQCGPAAPAEKPLLAEVGTAFIYQGYLEDGAITPGDLFVTSDTPGYAMRAGDDPPQGSVISRALSAFEAGSGYIYMIVTLQ